MDNRCFSVKHTETLEPSVFTEYMETPKEKSWAPGLSRFRCDKECLILIEKAINKVPQSKKTGADEIFVEALAINKDISSITIGALKGKCTEMRYVLTDWATAIMVPISEKSNHSKPESHRPIALLSRVKKVVNSLIAMRTRETYKFSEKQLRLQSGTGTETAILGNLSNGNHTRIIAVLDLKQAMSQ